MAKKVTKKPAAKRVKTPKKAEKKIDVTIKVEKEKVLIQPPVTPKEKQLTDDQKKVTCKAMSLDSLKTIDMVKNNAFFVVEKEDVEIAISYSRFIGKVEIGYHDSNKKMNVKKKLFSFSEFEEFIKKGIE